jgi:hypothetical protein
MTARSTERAQFLADIITTAVEGGINSWAHVDSYRWHDDTLCDPGCKHGPGDPWARATLVADDDGAQFDLTADQVARALGLIRDGNAADLELGDGLRLLILHADRKNDAGDIDAIGASAIVEIAWFGKVTYC